jgi:hypothetical protein
MSSENGESIDVDGSKRGRKPSRLVNCQSKVLHNRSIFDEIYDFRDAISAARVTKAKRPNSHVVEPDELSGELIVEL